MLTIASPGDGHHGLAPNFPEISPQKNGRVLSLNTVDGRNPAPVEVGRLSHYLQGSFHPWWLAGFLNHQQYVQNELSSWGIFIKTKHEMKLWLKIGFETWIKHIMINTKSKP